MNGASAGHRDAYFHILCGRVGEISNGTDANIGGSGWATYSSPNLEALLAAIASEEHREAQDGQGCILPQNQQKKDSLRIRGKVGTLG